MKIPWRKNVLVLVGAGYVTVLLVFGFLVWGGKTTPEAYKFIEPALMALIGGSLALSKDLVDDIPPDPDEE